MESKSLASKFEFISSIKRNELKTLMELVNDLLVLYLKGFKMEKKTTTEYHDFAATVMESYNIDAGSMTFLQKSENITYKITNSISEKEYLLRIHKSINDSDEYLFDCNMVESEMILLSMLSNCGKFSLQKPVCNAEGNYVTTSFDAITGKHLNATLLEWVDGETIDINADDNATLIGMLGEELGRFHKYTQSKDFEYTHRRPNYGFDSSRDELQIMDKLMELDVLSKEDSVFIREKFNHVIEALESDLELGKFWGIIHADLHEDNYVVKNDKISFIDFSRCGYGYSIADISNTMMHILPDKRRIFVEGYMKEMRLPENYEVMMEYFFALAIWGNIAFLSANSDELEHVDKMIKFLRERVLTPIAENRRFLLL